MENESPTPGTEVPTAAGGPGRKAEERTRSETVPDRQLGAGKDLIKSFEFYQEYFNAKNLTYKWTNCTNKLRNTCIRVNNYIILQCWINDEVNKLHVYSI